MRALASAVLAAVVLVHASAHAQHRPSPSEWRAAEALVRSHYAQRHVLEVRAAPYRSWGLSFWVRFQEDGGFSGHYAFVRSGNVLDAQGDDGVRAVLLADSFLSSRAWTAGDLALLLRELHATMPALHESPIMDPHAGVLAPRIVRANGTVTFVIYAHDGHDPPEAPARPHYYVTRATLHFAADYTTTWTTEDVILDAPLGR